MFAKPKETLNQLKNASDEFRRWTGCQHASISMRQSRPPGFEHADEDKIPSWMAWRCRECEKERNPNYIAHFRD